MSSGMKNKKRQGSVVFRITLWYSSFLLAFILVLLALVFLLSSNLADSAAKRELIESATEISQNASEYEALDDGIYYSIYDQSGSLIQKSLPKGFDESLPFNDSTVSTVTVNQRSYLYFDIELEGSGQWLRAVTLSSHTSHELTDYLLAVALVSPFLLVIIVAGGYWILMRAFKPVDLLAQTALDIRESGDFSKRLSLKERDDEFHRLGTAFNLMLDSLESSFQREKQFNSDVSHELRTPVAIILSESEYGLGYAEDMEESRESFGIIQRQAKYMKEMVSRILELSKVESQSSLETRPLSLSQLVQEKVADFQKVSQERGVSLQASIEPACHILGDDFLISRLLDNLLDNALKFTQDSVALSLSRLGPVCKLVIVDNGAGIAPEEMEKIWDRFYQIDRSRSKNGQQGTGLGLALVRQIADLHGAQIELDSQPGQGSRFILTFPLAETD